MTGFWVLYLAITSMCHLERDSMGPIVLGLYQMHGGEDGCGKAEEKIRAGAVTTERVWCEYYQPEPEEEIELEGRAIH